MLEGLFPNTVKELGITFAGAPGVLIFFRLEATIGIIPKSLRRITHNFTSDNPNVWLFYLAPSVIWLGIAEVNNAWRHARRAMVFGLRGFSVRNLLVRVRRTGLERGKVKVLA